MADEEVVVGDAELGAFDSAKKKKKKKPKEGGDAGEEEAAELSEKVKDLSVEDGADGAVPLDFGKKKKKKKPKEGEEVLGEEGEGEARADEEGGEEPLVPLLKKKKKKKQRAEDEELPEEALEEKTTGADAGEVEKAEEEDEDIPDDGGDMDEAAGEIELGGGAVLPTKLPWEGTDRDYLYEEMLGRVFDILRQNNPELAGDRRRTIMRPPQVLREGTKKTVFVNFMDLCKMMHRQPEHVMAFLLAELGTSGSLDGQQRLVVKGRFAPKNFEGLLRRYVNEYVMCQMCKSPDTILSKENRLHFVRCQQCGSHRSVSQIKAGFQARVKRRERTG